MRFSIIDLGTNSVRFDVYATYKNNRVSLIHREKQMVRLGDGLFKTGRLNKAAMLRTLYAFEEFERKIKLWKVQRVVAFATCALREAGNSEGFVTELKEKIGIKVKVISGREEARLIAQGVLRNETLPQGYFGLIDVGGGSCEFSFCRRKLALASFSFELGANRLDQVFELTASENSMRRKKEHIEKLKNYIQKTLKETIGGAKLPPINTVIGSSGTIRALEKMVKSRKYKDDAFTRKSLGLLLQEIIPLKVSDLLYYPGLSPNRADIILAGAILLYEVTSFFNVEEIIPTKFSLRDGIFEQELERISSRPILLSKSL